MLPRSPHRANDHWEYLNHIRREERLGTHLKASFVVHHSVATMVTRDLFVGFDLWTRSYLFCGIESISFCGILFLFVFLEHARLGFGVCGFVVCCALSCLLVQRRRLTPSKAQFNSIPYLRHRFYLRR